MREEFNTPQVLLCFSLLAVPCLLLPVFLAIITLHEFPLVLILTVIIAAAYIGKHWAEHSTHLPERSQVVKAAIWMAMIFVVLSIVIYLPIVAAANASVDNGPLWKWPILDAITEVSRSSYLLWDEIWSDWYKIIALIAFFLGEAIVSFGLIVTGLFYGRNRGIKKRFTKAN